MKLDYPKLWLYQVYLQLLSLNQLTWKRTSVESCTYKVDTIHVLWISFPVAFEVCFNNDTPRVNGSELFISFDSTAVVDSALCEIENSIGNQIASQDCKSNFMSCNCDR